MSERGEWTAFSKKERDYIAGNELNPFDIVNYFYNNLNIRRFSEVLNTFANGGNVRDLLIDKLCEYSKNISRDSIRKKVGNWLNDKNVPTEKAELIKLCFALGLDEQRSQAFMSYLSDGGFHLRNPVELAYLYCLRVKKSYAEAVEFVNGLTPVDFVNIENRPVFMSSADGDDNKIVYTKIIADAFTNIYDDIAFISFHNDNLSNFGNLHNTAYNRFMRFFNELTSPDIPLYAEKDSEYSIEDVVREYLRMNLPPEKETTKYDIIQKVIRSCWPNETSIKNMRNRKIDVSRKSLLLLYVITEGYESAEDNDFYSENPTPAELLEEHEYKLNLMLNECGMSRLDPRNPFDWLILYSLKTSEDDAGMSGCLQTVLDILFAETARE